MGRKPAGSPRAAKLPRVVGGSAPVRSLIGDDGSSAVMPAKPTSKPPKKAIGGKKPGRPGAFKKKVGHQKGQGGRGKPKPGGKR